MVKYRLFCLRLIAHFFTNSHQSFCQFISWTNWENSVKFRDNCWISCQVVADMKKVYDDLITINLYHVHLLLRIWHSSKHAKQDLPLVVCLDFQCDITFRPIWHLPILSQKIQLKSRRNWRLFWFCQLLWYTIYDFEKLHFLRKEWRLIYISEMYVSKS